MRKKPAALFRVPQNSLKIFKRIPLRRWQILKQSAWSRRLLRSARNDEQQEGTIITLAMVCALATGVPKMQYAFGNTSVVGMASKGFMELKLS